MSGHSKWAGIKHKKAIVDAKKGKEWTKVARMITLAASQSGGDPKFNFSLRLAMDKGKAVNMPSANIERAIKKGTGELAGDAVEDVLYEGYGPGGVAILVEAATDNKNRTVGEVRSNFSKYGGSMGGPGSVAYLFDLKGEISFNTEVQTKTPEEIELSIIESGADDFSQEGATMFVYTGPQDLFKVQGALEADEVKTESAELVYVPKNEVMVNDEAKAKSLLKLIDILESLDDVISVYSNSDIPAEILEKLS
jgi:YebC/PmpR family DNA-binding regulatory protein